MSIKYFDTLEYVRKAKELHDPEALAEYQVKQIETAIETAVAQVKTHVEEKELATKADLDKTQHALELKIANLRHELLKSILWTGTGGLLTLLSVLGGMIAHGFHWV